jgi:hypothetical protein
MLHLDHKVKHRANLVKEAKTMAEIAVKTRAIDGAEGAAKLNFWYGKEACWDKCNCPAMIKAECPAARYQFLPCWEIEGTYCKLDNRGATGRDTSVCQVCQVYKKYGNGEPIKLKLFGRGLDAGLKELEKVVL